MKYTDVIIVADCSGSMGHLQRKQQDAIWAIIQEFARAEADGQVFLVSLHRFGSAAYTGQHCGPFKPASAFKHEEMAEVLTNLGGTALLDAIGHAYTALGARGAEAQLIQVLTDGGENESRSWGAQRLGEALKQRADRLTVAVAGPAEAKYAMDRIGLSSDNFHQWDGRTEQSYSTAQAATVNATARYTQARKSGTRSVQNFYTVDPSKLSTAGVRSHMSQVVPTEVQTVSKRMAGRAIADAFPKFEKGRHYYQLIKPEYIEDGKELVVHIKDKNEYRLGSRTARILLGLPETGKIRVKPAETTAPFDIYVQSASVNRKLVEGQKLLTVP